MGYSKKDENRPPKGLTRFSENGPVAALGSENRRFRIAPMIIG